MVPRQSQRLTAASLDLEPDVEAALGMVEVTSSTQEQAEAAPVPVASAALVAGLDPTDVGWGGVIRIRRSRRELLWSLSQLAAPALLSLTAWLLTSNPAWLIGTGTAVLIMLAAVDHVCVNRGT
ncbi:hypothetical protein [Kineosporia sp. A_224]|uniref:hypothetical protein n=1 Tax=Kineosporia sp. A_224 TaxID=1962180 RepID=UPI00117A28BD|nr:hypothetical protein [Kineosporia sp. A_224]